jgi:hypothetical protein
MVLPVIGKKPEKKQAALDVAEAYNLWDLLKSRYSALENLKIWSEYVHDRDLSLIIGRYSAHLEKNIGLLEKRLETYAITGPDTHVPGMNTAVNSEIVRDQMIAQNVLVFLQEDVEMLLRAVRTSTTNDSIRAQLIRMTRDAVDRIDVFIKYVKAKGWIDVPPLYPHLPGNVQDKLDCGEAYHLWDHLTWRNDNTQQTGFYYGLANDPDFKTVLKRGQDVLTEQVEKLEKELLHFGIPLPTRPPSVMPGTINTVIAGDDNIFRSILTGMQGALTVHAQALKQCTVNDRIRVLFRDLLFGEIELFDKMVKFGKAKGWLNPPPRYGAVKP